MPFRNEWVQQVWIMGWVKRCNATETVALYTGLLSRRACFHAHTHTRAHTHMFLRKGRGVREGEPSGLPASGPGDQSGEKPRAVAVCVRPIPALPGISTPAGQGLILSTWGERGDVRWHFNMRGSYWGGGGGGGCLSSVPPHKRAGSHLSKNQAVTRAHTHTHTHTHIHAYHHNDTFS